MQYTEATERSPMYGGNYDCSIVSSSCPQLLFPSSPFCPTARHPAAYRHYHAAVTTIVTLDRTSALETNMTTYPKGSTPTIRGSFVFSIPCNYSLIFLNINRQMHLNCHNNILKNTLHSYMFRTSLVHHQGAHQSLHKSVMFGLIVQLDNNVWSNCSTSVVA